MRALIALCVGASLAAAPANWGSKVCARCHGDIYVRYSATPMALSSGSADSGPENFGEASFTGNGGYRYSVSRTKGKLVLSFSKTPIAERRDLAWYAGSGVNARSYLISVDGFLFEAPVTWYSRTGGWSFSPGYEKYAYPFLTRAIAPACLDCHATGVRALAETQNGYSTPPFLEGGIGCERCHGPGAAHAASGNPREIVNPAKLPAARRDSVCAQCHLSGEIRVDRSGKSMRDFVAGDDLADFTTAFVRAASERGMKVTSHFENLAQSACETKSGGRLWCGTCHDPHFVPSASEKAAWFRSKCETCHAAAVCGRGPDCIGCHMPRTRVTDAEHVVYTDHSIPRRPTPRDREPPANAPLAAFGGTNAGSRDLGLAYAIVALRENNAVYSAKAFDLLRDAEHRQPGEPQTLAYLADLYKRRNDDRDAAELYRRLRLADPAESGAPANLGAYAMESGRYEDAASLFREALKISPGLVLVRYNLALSLLRLGQAGAARSELEKVLVFHPAFAAAREALRQIPSRAP